MRVYVAGPLTKGDTTINVRKAIDAAETLLRLGFIPYCPHLTHFWHLIYAHDWNTWLTLDEGWLKVCHAVLRLKGESKGADREVKLARKLKIPVFHSIYALKKYRENLKQGWH